MSMTQKWAVETRNIETGETIRFIEANTENTANLLAVSANEYFTRSGRAYESFVVKA